MSIPSPEQPPRDPTLLEVAIEQCLEAHAEFPVTVVALARKLGKDFEKSEEYIATADEMGDLFGGTAGIILEQDEPDLQKAHWAADLLMGISNSRAAYFEQALAEGQFDSLSTRTNEEILEGILANLKDEAEYDEHEVDYTLCYLMDVYNDEAWLGAHSLQVALSPRRPVVEAPSEPSPGPSAPPPVSETNRTERAAVLRGASIAIGAVLIGRNLVNRRRKAS